MLGGHVQYVIVLGVVFVLVHVIVHLGVICPEGKILVRLSPKWCHNCHVVKPSVDAKFLWPPPAPSVI